MMVIVSNLCTCYSATATEGPADVVAKLLESCATGHFSHTQTAAAAVPDVACVALDCIKSSVQGALSTSCMHTDLCNGCSHL